MLRKGNEREREKERVFMLVTSETNRAIIHVHSRKGNMRERESWRERETKNKSACLAKEWRENDGITKRKRVHV